MVDAERVGEREETRQPIKLRFCKESNDLLYPYEKKESRTLWYRCRNCDYEEPADNNCVYRNLIDHKGANKTVVMEDVTTDPTLPRTRDTHCPRCDGTEAVFFSTTTAEGMNLFYQCTNQQCLHKWKDERL